MGILALTLVVEIINMREMLNFSYFYCGAGEG